MKQNATSLRDRRGRLITFEGIDGTGKSTHIHLLAATLRERGIQVQILREPGGTGIGEQIRQVLLSAENKLMSMETELLLFAAARSQLVRQVMEPALTEGTWVICDRFTDSTLAYQGYGRGLDLETIQRLNDLAAGSCRPDLTILLDIDEAEAAKRLARRAGQDAVDRLDQESQSFRSRVRTGYAELAKAEPQRIFQVSACAEKSVVAGEIADIVRRELLK